MIDYHWQSFLRASLLPLVMSKWQLGQVGRKRRAFDVSWGDEGANWEVDKRRCGKKAKDFGQRSARSRYQVGTHLSGHGVVKEVVSFSFSC